jgi:hypothetical protein
MDYRAYLVDEHGHIVDAYVFVAVTFRPAGKEMDDRKHQDHGSDRAKCSLQCSKKS